jgi:hypothetical protein
LIQHVQTSSSSCRSGDPRRYLSKSNSLSAGVREGSASGGAGAGVWAGSAAGSSVTTAGSSGTTSGSSGTTSVVSGAVTAGSTGAASTFLVGTGVEIAAVAFDADSLDRRW